jgi:hypothetical protein
MRVVVQETITGDQVPTSPLFYYCSYSNRKCITVHDEPGDCSGSSSSGSSSRGSSSRGSSSRGSSSRGSSSRGSSSRGSSSRGSRTGVHPGAKAWTSRWRT